MRFVRRRRRAFRSYVAMLAVALLSLSLVACGGSGGHASGSPSQDIHEDAGRVDVVNASSTTIGQMLLTGPNGSASFYNITPGTTVRFSNVAPGGVSVALYTSFGGLIDIYSLTVQPSSTTTLTLR